ncbi:PREDICTED: C2 domain-containing protein 5-like [Priapulus caudatus]|uniref:C2 domain-containing protein 5-like n=1 Tax=Priapulus caudatus TaxID=37621 RepID=A0ABM1DP16_PRICU|nr:PREDICTED: C2 domain-containing protein 5-like [Priapulus caudatus]
MPGKLKVKVIEGRNLPVMDRASDLTDAFVEVKFGNTTYKTEVFRKSLNPKWDSEYFRFEVDDEELQDEPLQLRVLDYDTYSANDSIGMVYIDLNPLLISAAVTEFSGWFPIFDTMHGIRGEIRVTAKVDLFTDFNKFKQSSCGIQFYCTAGIPYGMQILAVHGFVEELVVNDDPEYQWIDKIRTPRASNEARQRLFSKLSGELQRKIGLKVLELKGTAVIGYLQCFDLEGESGIVVRGIGTAVTLARGPPSMSHSPNLLQEDLKQSPLPEESVASPTSPVTMATPATISSSPTKTHEVLSQRRLSDTETGTPPRGQVVVNVPPSTGTRTIRQSLPLHQQQPFEMLEYPFVTMKWFPPGFVLHIGGVVSARSVKLLDKIHNPEEPETRDAWWMELRMEMRSHAKALSCNAVLGYSESTSICEEICVLSAIGTAAIVSLKPQLADSADAGILHPPPPTNLLRSAEKKDAVEKERVEKVLRVDVNLANAHNVDQSWGSQRSNSEDAAIGCSLCHVPYTENSLPFPTNLNKCGVCRHSLVPDVLFTTLEPPEEIQTIGKGTLIQAKVCRVKKEVKGEQNAKEISDRLPFMEYELHRRLLTTLKLKGMNAIFGLKVEVSVGDLLMVGVATGTAVYVAALPPPQIPKVKGQSSAFQAEDIQKGIIDTLTRNRDLYELNKVVNTEAVIPAPVEPDMDDEDGDFLMQGRKHVVVEIDDDEDEEVLLSLIQKPPPLLQGFDTCNTEFMPGSSNIPCDLQMFTRVWRGKISGTNQKHFSTILDNLVMNVCFRLRRLTPCALCNIYFNIDLPGDNDLLICMVGEAVGIGEPNSAAPPAGDLLMKAGNQQENDDAELQFGMDEVS